jgi:hypothetical protein
MDLAERDNLCSTDLETDEETKIGQFSCSYNVIVSLREDYPIVNGQLRPLKLSVFMTWPFLIPLFVIGSNR